MEEAHSELVGPEFRPRLLAVGLVGFERLMRIAIYKEGGLASGVDGGGQQQEGGGFAGSALVALGCDDAHGDFSFGMELDLTFDRGAGTASAGLAGQRRAAAKAFCAGKIIAMPWA